MKSICLLFCIFSAASSYANGFSCNFPLNGVTNVTAQAQSLTDIAQVIVTNGGNFRYAGPFAGVVTPALGHIEYVFEQILAGDGSTWEKHLILPGKNDQLPSKFNSVLKLIQIAAGVKTEFIVSEGSCHLL